MSRIRPPKSLGSYATAEDAARGLEQLAATIRQQAAQRPRVRWSLNLWFWNAAWNSPQWNGDMIVRNVSYQNNPEP